MDIAIDWSRCGPVKKQPVREPFLRRMVLEKEIAACQSDMAGMADAAVFPISRCGRRNARRAPNRSAAISSNV